MSVRWTKLSCRYIEQSFTTETATEWLGNVEVEAEKAGPHEDMPVTPKQDVPLSGEYNS